MNRMLRLLVAGPLTLVVGCMAAQPNSQGAPTGSADHLGMAGDARNRPGDTPVAGELSAPPVHPVLKAAKGTLAFQVLWPARAVQTIPTAASSIYISVQASGSEIGSITLVRPDTSSAIVSSGSVDVEAATGLTVVARAYESGSPNRATDPVLAAAASTDVAVVDGQNTEVRLTLVAPGAPNLASVSPPAIGVGGKATVTGANLGPAAGLPFTIGLVTGGETIDLSSGAVGASSGGSDTITFTLPSNARNGKILVKTNGTASNELPFKIISMLAISPASPSVQKGTDLQFTALASDSPELGSNQTVIASPVVQWSLGGLTGTESTLVATISETTGLLTAIKAGTLSVVVSSGKASASTLVTVP